PPVPGPRKPPAPPRHQCTARLRRTDGTLQRHFHIAVVSVTTPGFQPRPPGQEKSRGYVVGMQPTADISWPAEARAGDERAYRRARCRRPARHMLDADAIASDGSVALDLGRRFPSHAMFIELPG